MIISQRAKDLYWVYWCLLWDNMGGKGSELFLPSVCDLLRKMVLARGWSEGLYSMGRSGSRSNRINPLRMDLKPKWMATTDTTISSQQNVLSTGVATLWWRWDLTVSNKVKQCFDSLKSLFKWQKHDPYSNKVILIWNDPYCFKISLFLLIILILYEYWGEKGQDLLKSWYYRLFGLWNG